MNTPLFSIVIPTRDRNDLLALCLGRLAPGVQTLSADRYEIIVSDDSVSGAAQAFVAERFPWVRHTMGPRRGPAANRNHGATLATGELIVFLDDDCLPEVGLLAGYAEALLQNVGAYEGRITCRAGFDSPRETAPINLTGGALWSCNFAIRRPVFAEIGGFDERFPLPHMEDVDMRLRILAAGNDIIFVPAASVDHPPRRLPWGAKLGRMHQATVLFEELHPPQHGLFWFLQNQLRARLSYIVRFSKSLDSLTALLSIPFELGTIALRWNGWKEWARRTVGASR